MKQISKTGLFLLITFVVSYSVAGLFYFSGLGYSTIYGVLMAAGYMFIPALSVFLTEKLVHQERISRRLLISFNINAWFFVAWLLPPVLAGLTFAVSLLFPGVHYSPGAEGMLDRYSYLLPPDQLEVMKQELETLPMNLGWLILIQGLIAGITINAVAGFGEELGWRGFLVRQFENMKFWKAAVITGFIWGIWHAPIILMGHNYPQHPVAGVFMMTLWCILLSPLFLYITIKSKSVLAASILHGTINATNGLAIITLSGGSDLLTGLTGLAGFIAIGIVIAAFVIYDRLIVRENIMQGRVGSFLPAVPESFKNSNDGKG